jgi:hypothetical protein
VDQVLTEQDADLGSQVQGRAAMKGHRVVRCQIGGLLKQPLGLGDQQVGQLHKTVVAHLGDPVEVALGKIDGRLRGGLSGCVAGIEPGGRHQVGGRLANRPVQARDPATRVG